MNKIESLWLSLTETEVPVFRAEKDKEVLMVIYQVIKHFDRVNMEKIVLVENGH